MSFIKNTGKKLISEGKSFVFHKESNDYAKKVLKIIEKDRGHLDQKDRDLCLEYAKDVFGHERYAPWLFVYSAYQREFKEGWIPDNYYGDVVVQERKGRYGQVCNRNAVIGKIIGDTDSLDLAYYINDLFVDTELQVLQVDKLKELLFDQHQTIVYKNWQI